MRQPTFASVEFEQKKRKTRRELFLERIDGLVPWDELEGRIEPYYPKAGRGRRPYPLTVMLRIHCVQLCYNLSDPAMEALLYEAESVRRFCGLTLTEAIPTRAPSSTSATCWSAAADRDELERWTRCQKTAQALALRARIVLAAGDGRATPISQPGWG